MPIYEYRCDGCNHKSDLLWRSYSPPDAVECKSCGSGETHRVISSVALHKTMGTKMSELDSKYDRMLDAADSSNPARRPQLLPQQGDTAQRGHAGLDPVGKSLPP